MRTSTVVGLMSLSVLGCGGQGCSSTSEPPAASAAAATTSGESAPAAADYEVHEWGLLRAQAVSGSDVLRVGAIAPPRPVELMAVDKPVLYFHTTSARTLASVSVRAEGGAILETWPYVVGQDTGLGYANGATWQDVALAPSGACEPSPLPGPMTPPCLLLGAGSFCESAGLAIVRTDDAACVRAAGMTERFLFYRAQSSTFTPPLRFTRTQVHEDVSVTNDGDAPIPGVMVRIWSDGASTRTLVARPPAPHASIVIGHDFSGSADDDIPADSPVAMDRRGATDESLPAPTVTGPGRDGIRRTMTELGLTASEIDAFMRAWDGTLFGGAAAHAGNVTDGTAVDVLSVDGDPAPRESLLYFLPESTADGVATLTFDPPARRVRRALAIWTAIRASGEGH